MIAKIEMFTNNPQLMIKMFVIGNARITNPPGGAKNIGFRSAFVHDLPCVNHQAIDMPGRCATARLVGLDSRRTLNYANAG